MNTFFSDRMQRILFSIVVLITIGFLLYPKYLPMVDLPQHVGLVVSFDDLLKGKSVWSSMLWINWDTPYIGSYLYWLLWYQVLPILWATKAVIISIFLLYIYAIRLLRRTFQADRMLDWVGLTCFFGYSFQYGFVSYMAGAAFGLLFLALNKRYLDNPNKKDWWLILLTGVLTYFNHLLAFTFFCMTAYAYFIFSSLKPFSWQQRIKFTLPYVLFALLLLHYLTTPNPVQSDLWQEHQTVWSMDKSFNIDLWKIKLSNLLIFPWDIKDFKWVYIVLLLLPLLLAKHNKKYYIILSCALVVYFILPDVVRESNHLYRRFAWMVVVFYFLLWQPCLKELNMYQSNIMKISSLLFMAIISFLMFEVYINNIRFAHSQTVKDFDTIFQIMQPRKRILYINERNNNPYGEFIKTHNVYHDFPVYYQALKHGWYDPSYASEHAIPVRLNKNSNYNREFLISRAFDPKIMEKELNCTPYDYIIIRSHFNANIINKILVNNLSCKQMKVIIETKSAVLLSLDK